MNFKQFFQRLFGPNKQEPSFSRSGVQSDQSEMMQKLSAMLSGTQDVELSCDDIFALLDQFAELAAQGEDVAQLMPLVKQHLEMCADCREEYKVLERIVHGTA
jgi:predicted component of type VI protein secretion system